MSNIIVLDYGSSNLHSVVKALETVADSEHTVMIGNRTETILGADRIVFPGQGAIGQCMSLLKEQALDEVIAECIVNKPFLGICLGLQSLMEHSEEDGGIDGLSILPGKVVRFADHINDKQGNPCKIPAIGWNQVYQNKPHPLWTGIRDGSHFYFIHSYYVKPELESDIAGTTEYSCIYTSAVARENLFATQFHPEKSQHAGLTLLKNFINWDGVS